MQELLESILTLSSLLGGPGLWSLLLAHGLLGVSMRTHSTFTNVSHPKWVWKPVSSELSAPLSSQLESVLCSAFWTHNVPAGQEVAAIKRISLHSFSGVLSSTLAPHPSCLGIFKHHLLLLFQRDNVHLNFFTCLPFCPFAAASLWFRLSFHHFPSSGTPMIQMT